MLHELLFHSLQKVIRLPKHRIYSPFNIRSISKVFAQYFAKVIITALGCYYHFCCLESLLDCCWIIFKIFLLSSSFVAIYISLIPILKCFNSFIKKLIFLSTIYYWILLTESVLTSSLAITRL